MGSGVSYRVCGFYGADLWGLGGTYRVWGGTYRVCGLYGAALWGPWGPIGFGGSTGRPYGIQRGPTEFGAALWDLGGNYGVWERSRGFREELIGFVGSRGQPYRVWGVL